MKSGRQTPGRRAQSHGVAVSVYIGVVVVLASALALVTARTYGVVVGFELGAFAVLAIGQLLIGDVVVGRRVVLSFSSIVLLAGQAILGPAGAGLLGLVMGTFISREAPPRARVFNAAQFSVYGMLGGIAFVLAGGTADPAALTGAGDLAVRLALPMLVADVTQLLANVVLLAGVVRFAQGVPVGVQVRSLLESTGAAYLGYGAIAFIMIVLWRPADLGPAASVVVLAPLLVAQWAYLQHAEELRGRQLALEVLVAALEAKAPHLIGHSDRVAELSGFMAEHLGLRPHAIADVRVAGMLHDIGQTSLPTPQVRSLDLTRADLPSDFPAKGAEILRDISFLDGALGPIATHRRVLGVTATGQAATEQAAAARIVGVADAFDLLTEVGTPDGRRYSAEEARELLFARPAVDADLLQALDSALTRRADGGTP